jgi:hypothetical protein
VQLHRAFIPLLVGVLTGAAVLAAPTPTVITSDQPGSVQRGITEAYRTGQKRIVIPAGTYYIKPPSAGSHLRFHGMSDFEIDARDVHFVFTDQTRGGIEFLNCRNVRLRGASIRFETPPFTQAVVEGIAPDGAWYDVRIEKGYPTNFDDARYFPAQPIGYLFDSKTRWWKPGTYDLYGQSIKRLGADRFRVFWNVPAGPRLHPVAVGDLMGFRGSGPHNVTIVTSTRVSLIGVTIYNAGSFAVWESGGDGDNRYSITVKRGPRPPEAVTDPLFSSTADAFHSTDVRKGPVLEQCYFEAMADDGIAIHGTYSLVLSAGGNKFVINDGNFRPGDPLRLFDPRGQPAGEALVRSIQPLEGFHNTKKSHRAAISDHTAGPYFEVMLDRPLPADFDYLVSNPAATGSGYVLRENTIRNHRARGMLLKADNGLVEGNLIEGSTMGGIVVTPEFWWYEADYSRNVTIRNNTIRQVAYAPRQLGAVLVAAVGEKPIPGCGHQHIVLDGNRFEDLNGVNLLISSACDVTVKNNLFIRPQRFRVEAGGMDEEPGSLIDITQAKDVRFENNTILGIGRFNTRIIQVSSTASVSGLQSGVELK